MKEKGAFFTTFGIKRHQSIHNVVFYIYSNKAISIHSRCKMSENKQKKADRFKKVATRRTITALTAIRKLRKVATRNNYEYTEEELEAICKALYNEVQSLEKEFKLRFKGDDPISFDF